MKNNFALFWAKNRKKILFILVFLSLTFVFCRPVLDPDFGWHLRNGQILVTEHRFVQNDEFSWTMEGKERAYNYWLTEASFYLFFSAGLYPVLIIVFALITSVALLLTIEKTVKNGNFWAKIFALIFGGVLLLYQTAVRPQVVSILFFSLLWMILVRGFYSKKIFLYLLPLLFIFWANFHYAFILGLSFLAIFFILEATAFFLKKRNLYPAFLHTKVAKKDVFSLGIVLLLSAFATLLTPYGFLTYRTIFEDFLSFETRANVAEWLPLVFGTPFGFYVFIFLVATVIFIALSWKKVYFPIFVLWFLSVVLSLFSQRHLPFFVITSLTFFVGLWPFKFEKYLKGGFWINFFGFSYLVLFCFVLIIFQISNLLGGINPQNLARNKALSYPVDAVSFLKNNPQEGNMFNAYRWGGYLVWELPEAKTFIDGRMSGWRGDAFSDYLKISKISKDTFPLLDKWNVSWVFIEKESSLAILLEKSPFWEKIYEDEIAVIFKKKT